jgi:hypothetical protein
MGPARYVVTLTCTVFIGACAAPAPVEDVQLFNRAFVNVEAASQPLFDDLAVAERRLGRENAMTRAREKPPGSAGAAPPGAPGAALCKEGMPGWRGDPAPGGLGFITGFCIEDAAYFSPLGDPPATRAFRSGVNVLGRYSELLLILAEGRNIDAAKAQIQEIGANVSAGLALVPGVQIGVPALLPALKLFDPLIEEAARANNFEELRRVVTQGAPHFSKLTVDLQAATPRIFDVLAGHSMQQVTPTALKNRPVAEALIANIEGYRRILSDYVLLLQELDLAHRELVLALQRGRPATLAGLAERSERLTRTAEAMRQGFVVLRRGPAP